jgi:hypothetical protein
MLVRILKTHLSPYLAYQMSRDFVLQEHGYHTKDPKVPNVGGRMREIKRAMKDSDGRLETSEKHTARQRVAPILPRFRTLMVR